MANTTADQLRQSLSGPWKYEDSRLSFRWDPLDDRRYAYAWNNPSDEEVHTEHGANSGRVRSAAAARHADSSRTSNDWFST